MFTIQTMDTHPTYQRLMQAAEALKGKKTNSEVGELLELENPSQMMTNWKKRGVPANMITKVARKIGCHPFWLEDGEGDMIYDNMLAPDLAIALKIMEPLTPYGRQVAIKSLNQATELIEQVKAANEK